MYSGEHVACNILSSNEMMACLYWKQAEHIALLLMLQVILHCQKPANEVPQAPTGFTYWRCINIYVPL